ncbi:MAG: tetratricopeptide repeat protein [Candidatus Auribacterota bacterium]|nr:tetratricopeptide repeat protein [Candidatus Auribacterota bacterium]
MKRLYFRLVTAVEMAVITGVMAVLAQTVLALDEAESVVVSSAQSFSEIMPFSFAEFSSNNERSRICAGVHFSMGIIYREQERFDDALKEMTLAIRLHPRNAALLAYAGDIYKRIGDIDRAIDFYRKAVALEPDYKDAYLPLAGSYQVKRLYDQAIECYRNAIRLDPEYDDAYRQLAQLLIRQRRDDEAILVYRSILKDDSSPQLWYELAKVYGRINRLGDAVEAYIKSIELDGSLYPAHLGLAVLYDKKLGDYQKALFHYRACEKIYHNSKIHERIEELKRGHSSDDKKQHEAQKKSGQVGLLNSSEL